MHGGNKFIKDFEAKIEASLVAGPDPGSESKMMISANLFEILKQKLRPPGFREQDDGDSCEFIEDFEAKIQGC